MNGLLRLSRRPLCPRRRHDNHPALSVHSIFRDRAGRLWAGGSRLLCIDGSVATPYSLGAEPSQNQVKSIRQTSDGTLWVGTVTGLNRMLARQDHL